MKVNKEQPVEAIGHKQMGISVVVKHVLRCNFFYPCLEYANPFISISISSSIYYLFIHSSMPAATSADTIISEFPVFCCCVNEIRQSVQKTFNCPSISFAVCIGNGNSSIWVVIIVKTNWVGAEKMKHFSFL